MKRQDVLAGEPIGLVECSQLVGAKDVEPGGRANPQIACRIIRERLDGIGAQAIAAAESFFRIPAVQALLGAEPNPTLAIFVDRRYARPGSDLLESNACQSKQPALFS